MSVAQDASRIARIGKGAVKDDAKRGAFGRDHTDELTSALERLGTKLHFGRGQTIFNEGDPALFLYRIASGAVRLCKHTAGGRRQIADFALAGEFFGFVRVSEHMLTAEAITNVTLLSYPLQQVERLGEEIPAIRRRLLGFLSERLLGMQDHLVMLGRQTAMERVASFLLVLLERRGEARRTAIEIPMSRLDIADYLGLTLETVSRTLAELKHACIIDLDGPHLAVVRDVDALHSMAEGDDGQGL